MSWSCPGKRLGDVVAENIVVVTYEEDPAQRSNLLETNPLWPTLPAVQAGRVHVIDGGNWNNFGPIALVAFLDEAAALLGP